MEEFIRKMSEYGPVKDEFTKVLQVEVEEQDLENIMAAAAKEKENIGQIVDIYKKKRLSKKEGGRMKQRQQRLCLVSEIDYFIWDCIVYR